MRFIRGLSFSALSEVLKNYRSAQQTPPKSPGVVLPSPRLCIEAGGQAFELEGSFVIGGAASCDLRLEAKGVEPHHAEIYQVGTLWWLRDLGSDSGTFLDGEIVDAAPLRAPSEIRLGLSGPTLRLQTAGPP